MGLVELLPGHGLEWLSVGNTSAGNWGPSEGLSRQSATEMSCRRASVGRESWVEAGASVSKTWLADCAEWSVVGTVGSSGCGGETSPVVCVAVAPWKVSDWLPVGGWVWFGLSPVSSLVPSVSNVDLAVVPG